MKCSIVMATHNRPDLLSRTLESIRRQKVPFEYELIVVDDSSADLAYATQQVVAKYSAGYFKAPREDGDQGEYRNPGPARNFGYRVARGEIVICQSDDVIHHTPDAIERMAAGPELECGNFIIATVYNGEPADPTNTDVYTAPWKPEPLFFLGAIRREHIYAIGGNDEDFDEPGYEDNFFADCLIRGLKLEPTLPHDIVGIHQPHERPRLARRYRRMRAVYERKFAYCTATGVWQASGGPWPMDHRTV